MKFAISLMTIILVFFTISCEESNLIEIDNSPLEVATKSSSTTPSEHQGKNTAYKVHCEGPCDCGLEGSAGSHVSCKCSDCIMIIETESTNGNFELVDAELEIPLLQDFNTYISKNRTSTDELAITLIEVQSHNGTTAVKFTYTVGEITDDVIIVEERSGKKYEISCDGICGCTARFEFDPPAASCGCSDCVMTVNEIE